MKEIIDLHQRILALPAAQRPEEGVEFDREEADEWVDELPPEFRAEIEALQKAVNPLIPEDFDYVAYVGSEEEFAEFVLTLNATPAQRLNQKFDPERSLLEQLPEVDWEERRQIAGENDQRLEQTLYAARRSSFPLPSAKNFQKTHREEMKDFIKEKRSDLSKIHVLYWEETDGLMENDFADAPAFRDALPLMIEDGAEIITVVVNGKPLPVERIDTLKVEAQQILKDRPSDQQDDAEEANNDDVVDIEAEEVTKNRVAELPNADEKSREAE